MLPFLHGPSFCVRAAFPAQRGLRWLQSPTKAFHTGRGEPPPWPDAWACHASTVSTHLSLTTAASNQRFGLDHAAAQQGKG